MDKELPLLPYRIRPSHSWRYRANKVSLFWEVSSGRFFHHVRYTDRYPENFFIGVDSTYHSFPRTLTDPDGSWEVSLSQIVEGRRVYSSMINSPLTINSIKELILLATGYPIAPFQDGSRAIKFWEHPASLLKELNNVE